MRSHDKYYFGWTAKVLREGKLKEERKKGMDKKNERESGLHLRNQSTWFYVRFFGNRSGCWTVTDF